MHPGDNQCNYSGQVPNTERKGTDRNLFAAAAAHPTTQADDEGK